MNPYAENKIDSVEIDSSQMNSFVEKEQVKSIEISSSAVESFNRG